MDQSDFDKLLTQLQEIQFALVELNLYLDNHPDDAAAINQFNQLVKQRREVARKFECRFGPLFNFGLSKSPRCHWQWVDQPWPWQV
ncbi:spore coat protein CotJB [Paenibacillus alvei]|uniref:Spore coat protein CotJB n=1 Tax=Paenibacillus alvei TaxID=44250 RepID=A0ABT4GRN8_PAEAL|nr:spore coat protein CotJB [Paenibacillus alvei]EJW18627.1 hypothetical protein PAV_2c03930 [Paenibacillus alvei DSM 29]MCY9539791.1 spore coat protein CotJB [Paenibacillus alvei]MCY9703312.1 spore coat protein CotJB [Paenibacillus alvei]MCY9735466.1 spore coat protein CotJB [Paenibacillus alvei]MCY9753052.1 spore coat protein CotJB [Paenibacillus alvei]